MLHCNSLVEIRHGAFIHHYLKSRKPNYTSYKMHQHHSRPSIKYSCIITHSLALVRLSGVFVVEKWCQATGFLLLLLTPALFVEGNELV